MLDGYGSWRNFNIDLLTLAMGFFELKLIVILRPTRKLVVLAFSDAKLAVLSFGV